MHSRCAHPSLSCFLFLGPHNTLLCDKLLGVCLGMYKIKNQWVPLATRCSYRMFIRMVNYNMHLFTIGLKWCPFKHLQDTNRMDGDHCNFTVYIVLHNLHSALYRVQPWRPTAMSTQNMHNKGRPYIPDWVAILHQTWDFLNFSTIIYSKYLNR